MTTYSAQPFTPLTLSLHHSYQQVKQSFTLLCKLMVVRLCIEGMLAAFFLCLFVTVGVGSIVSHASVDQVFSLSYFSLFGTYNMWIFTTGVIGIGFAYLITMALLSIATIITLSKKTQSLNEILSLSISSFTPFFLTQLFCLLLVLGGFFAFILPGIGMMVFFTFVPFVVIFEKKSGLLAMKKSISLIIAHPVSLIGRILLVWGIGVLTNMILFSFILPSLGIGLQIFCFILTNSFLWWYSQAYLYLLYQQAKKGSVPDVVSLTRVLLLSVCGWALIICLCIGMYTFVQSGQAKQLFFSKQTQPSLLKPPSYAAHDI